MDITQDFADANFIITGYKPGCVLINHEPQEQSFIITPESLVTSWDVTDVSQLSVTNLTCVFDNPPEIMIIGTGEALVLPDPKIIALFAKHQIGLETMNTSAACRTYGILIAEGRKAAAGIIFNS